MEADSAGGMGMSTLLSTGTMTVQRLNDLSRKSFTSPIRSRSEASDGIFCRRYLSARNTIARFGSARSEEHTSELQSHLNLVCRLLLEKKKIRREQRKIDTMKTTTRV